MLLFSEKILNRLPLRSKVKKREMGNSRISIVLSLYNEQEGVKFFSESLREVLLSQPNTSFELIWVNDGSIDGTQLLIDEIRTSETATNIEHITIQFSRNFGHEAAMIAGIDNASGEAIICMDSDGQHPPELIPLMVDQFNKGNDIVLMERTQRADGGFIKKSLSRLFYRILNSLSTFQFEANSTDFFLISKQVATILRENYRERSRFIRGFIQQVGFAKAVIPFQAPERKHGVSAYSFGSLFRLAFNAIFSFSNKPLRLCIGISVVFILFTILLTGYSLFEYFYGETPPSGYTTIVIFLSLSFSILFVVITILSLYFEKALQEIRQRPIYIIKKICK